MLYHWAILLSDNALPIGISHYPIVLYQLGYPTGLLKPSTDETAPPAVILEPTDCKSTFYQLWKGEWLEQTSVWSMSIFNPGNVHASWTVYGNLADRFNSNPGLA